MIVAYQGIEGAFGHEAARTAFPDHQTFPCQSFAAVGEAVRDGAADCGVLPVENSRAGEVEGVRDIIATAGLSVERFVDLPIRMHLLGLPGARTEELTKVISHPVALRQCRDNLAKMGVTQEEATNTAVAAQSLADRSSGALASLLSAQLYGLDVLMMDIQDDPDNVTSFAVIRRP